MRLLNFVLLKSAKEEGGKKGVQKIAENIRYVRRDAFVDVLLFL